MANSNQQTGGQGGFHVSREARERYQFEEAFFSLRGTVVLPNFHAARRFAQKMNDKRDLVNYPEQAVKAGQINALALIHDALHLLVTAYREQVNPRIIGEALQSLYSAFGEEATEATLHRFAEEFPPLVAYRREVPVDQWLEGASEGTPHREIALEEMLMLWVSNLNPAFSPYLELFDDTNLEKYTIYPHAFTNLQGFFDKQPGFGADGRTLIDWLRAPALASPHSLAGQLEFLRARMGHMLGAYFYRLLSGLDLIAEEEKVVFAGGGPGPAEVYQFAGMEADPERFSADLDWMPRLVLMAKNSYVWIDQLSRKYGRAISRLDQIPDEELDALAARGITGLWLIGLWERSPASQRIKQLTGNPEAVASAYSLMDYQIAGDLGGYEAYAGLRDRAWARGVRLASDMVPNHMGIDSNWVMNHPEWFLQLDYSPYPSYSFNGPNLSWNDGVGIYLEDHYYDRTDAAVVFKRVEHSTGQERYIYHGNDGTSMPWNDTAQLNYLDPTVREAVIQTILSVARQFPVIRFDAAMTLAKRHIQRLWFPEPGSGGAIASRAEHGMPRAQFEAMIPVEFWREVVDRVAQEAPDTLLLAEAFWMMEGYFVRTLGMHRVYNSAFMHMLRDEDNAKYRATMKNTLEFDPEILRRYVNFMSNPDERTAVDQFGKEDKYFGVCTLMVTMPGLPMFGHGQLEGFTEKYGMEYRRAYWDEQPDTWLIQRHEREIFPLMHRRYVFAGVENFLLYDFFSAGGGVNEDVFAYSNRFGDERALVVVHNRYAEARGWIRTSAAYSVRAGDERRLTTRTLGEGLGLTVDGSYFTIYRDQMTGLEYIRNSKELSEQGMYLELGAYKSRVFLDFREVQDNQSRHYSNLAAYLGGRGVPSMEEALRETFLQPIHHPFRELVNAGMFQRLMEARASTTDQEPDRRLLDDVEQKFVRLLQEVKTFTGATADERILAGEIRGELSTALRLSMLAGRQTDVEGPENGPASAFLASKLTADPALWGTVFGWLFTHALGKVMGEDGYEEQSRSWIDEWLLGRMLAAAFGDLGLDQGASSRAVTLVKVLTGHQRCFEQEALQAQPAAQILETWLKDDDVRQFIGVNRYQGVLWFNKESFDQLLWWMLLVATIRLRDEAPAVTGGADPITVGHAVVAQLQEAEAKSNFRLDDLLEAARVNGAGGSAAGQSPEAMAMDEGQPEQKRKRQVAGTGAKTDKS